MKLVIFGLAVSSSWGNGHATLWRGLIRGLAGRGHRTVFFERDVPWYAEARDLAELPGGRLVLYPGWGEVAALARAELRAADAVIVTSYCPDAPAATALALEEARGVRAFYDLDTPVTLAELGAGREVGYIGAGGLAGFDLVLSYTGGAALTALRERLGARRVAPLYGSVDPAIHRPQPPQAPYRGDLGYIGTYAADRQAALDTLFIEPARRQPGKRFVIAGAQYPQGFPWTSNIHFLRHLPPSEHPAFFASSRATLNVTRAAMAQMGYCPSGRLFEAAACGTPILSDLWEGLDLFYRPGEEILPVETPEDTMAALSLGDAELLGIAARARERTLEEHTADRRAAELEALLFEAVPCGA